MSREAMAWWKPIRHPFWWLRHRHLTALIRQGVRLTYAAKCERQSLLDYFEPRIAMDAVEFEEDALPGYGDQFDHDMEFSGDD